MRVLIINSVCGIRSTGRICVDLAREYERRGDEVKIAYGRLDQIPDDCRKYGIKIGDKADVWLHGIRSRLFDEHGLGSKRATKKFLDWADEYDPDVLWLHNIHGYYINYELLFEWIKRRPEMEVKWTLHDCWAFTGHCAHFTVAGCSKWRTQCERCVQSRRYPSSLLLDNSRSNYQKKKKSFCGVNNLTLITPSHWLERLVKQGFLSDYPVEVQYNTVDADVFKPTDSDFRKRYDLEGKIIILGVSNVWDKSKGLDDFVKLSGLLDDRFKIVLVGVTKRQRKHLPRSILAIERTDNVNELVKIYSAADYFVNPSREETFGLTSYEAALCGTPAIVYKGTACEEVVEIYKGHAVDPDVESIYAMIMDLIEKGNC